MDASQLVSEPVGEIVVASHQENGKQPLPPATHSVISNGLFRLTQAQAAEVSRKVKEALQLGILGQTKQLQEQWDAVVPPEMPYDPEEDRAKPFECMASHLAKIKGRTPVMTISKATLNMGTAVFESLVRVLLAAPPGVGYKDRPFNKLERMLGSGELCGQFCTQNDCEIVKQILLLRTVRARRVSGSGMDRYGELDITTLTMLQKKIHSDLPKRLEKWGILVAQAVIDFLRGLGEIAANFNWEKKCTFNEFFARGVLRNLTFITGTELSYDAMSDLWKRSSD